MIKKSKYIVSAWISLMAKKVASLNEIGLKEILFKKEEIINEAQKMMAPEKQIRSADFEALVVESGYNGEKYFLKGPKGSLSEYFILARPEEYGGYSPQTYIDILCNHADIVGIAMHKSEISRILVKYYNFIADIKWPEQIEYPDMIARDAVWLAAAALTYNDWSRSDNKQDDFWYRQKTIAYVANSFNANNTLGTCRQMTRVDCTLGKSSQGYTYFTGKESERRRHDSERRLTRADEARETIPNCPNSYEISTIVGNITSGKLKEFVRGVYSKRNTDEGIALDINVPYNVQENHAVRLSDASLYQAAVLRSGIRIPSTTAEVKRYYRDPYIAQYVKRLANGRCQLCQKPAPFTSLTGEPYLETHHIEWLSEGGSDSLSNVVALCPNCHRKMHNLNLQEDKDKLLEIARQYYSNSLN